MMKSLNIELEKLFFLEALADTKWFEFGEESFFKDETYKLLYSVARQFFYKYKSPLTKAQLKQVVLNNEKLSSKISMGDIDVIFKYENERTSLDSNWVTEQLEAWIKYNNLQKSFQDISSYMSVTQVDADNINSVITKVKQIVVDANNVSFDDTIGYDFFDPKAHKVDVLDLISSGKNFYDRYTKGYERGNLIAYIGPPNVGKSQFLGNDAAYFVRAGFNVVLISAEMKETQFIHRIGANVLGIPKKKYMDWSQDEGRVSQKLKELDDEYQSMGRNLGKFMISQMVDPNVLQIENKVKKIEDHWGQKVDVVIVDYIGICSDYRNPNTENTYLKGKNITKDMRDTAMLHDWLFITGNQTNADGMDSSDLSMKSIAESKALAHNADVLYGIIQDPMMLNNDEYWLKIIKNRDGAGKGVKCKYKMNWEYLRLEETTEIEEKLSF